MAHYCFKQDCGLEVQYICSCLSSETYCCELHLGTHLKLPNRIHTFDSILVEPSEGTKDAILEFLTKEKSKKEKLKKIILTSFNSNISNSKNNSRKILKRLDYDLKEINDLIEKISQNLKQDQGQLLNLQSDNFKMVRVYLSH